RQVTQGNYSLDTSGTVREHCRQTHFAPLASSMRRHVVSRANVVALPVPDRPSSPRSTLLSALIEGALRRRCMLVSDSPVLSCQLGDDLMGQDANRSHQGRGVWGATRFEFSSYATR